MPVHPVLPLVLLALAAACADAGAERAPAAAPAAEAPPPAPAPWTVTPDGAGPVRVGMSVEELRGALGGAVEPDSAGGECGYVRPRGGPAGVAFMVVGGRVARVDVDSAGIATAEGARIGDAEPRIQQLYPGRMEVQPHKYTEGQYLVVTPADSTRRLVFETDEGGRVVRFRGGRLPEVEWVEGCG
ncbi:MAG TPA: hypothetical protein VF263_03285 [Longimicrobiaceae bacterium]